MTDHSVTSIYNSSGVKIDAKEHDFKITLESGHERAANTTDSILKNGVMTTNHTFDQTFYTTWNGFTYPVSSSDVWLDATYKDVIIGNMSKQNIVQLGGLNPAVGKEVVAVTDPAYNGVAHNIVFDTFSNIGIGGVKIGDTSTHAIEINYAVASDTGIIYYDADGNWTTGALQIGTVGINPDISITNFTTI